MKIAEDSAARSGKGQSEGLGSMRILRLSPAASRLPLPEGEGLMRALFALSFVLALTPCAGAQTMVEHSSEARFQLDLHVPDAALMSYIPQGFTLNIATDRKSVV